MARNNLVCFSITGIIDAVYEQSYKKFFTIANLYKTILKKETKLNIFHINF